MYLFIFLLCLIFFFVIAFFTELDDVTFDLDTDKSELLIAVFWLSRAVSVRFYKEGVPSTFSQYLLDRRVKSKAIDPSKQRRRGNYRSKIGSLNLERAHCEAFYGFSSPFFTGISNGVFPVIQTIIPNIPIEMVPDFFSDHEYLVVKAKAKLNLGKTAVNLFRSKNKRSELSWIS